MAHGGETEASAVGASDRRPRPQSAAPLDGEPSKQASVWRRRQANAPSKSDQALPGRDFSAARAELNLWQRKKKNISEPQINTRPPSGCQHDNLTELSAASQYCGMHTEASVTTSEDAKVEASRHRRDSLGRRQSAERLDWGHSTPATKAHRSDSHNQ